MEENALIKADYYPTIPRTEIAENCKYKVSIADFANWGNHFALAASVIAKAAMNAPTEEGLYRCVFPAGVTGELASFKDGSGKLGAIMNENGIVGQARWIPVEGQSVAMSIDPVSVAVAAAMISVDQKLDSIQKSQQEIIQFLQHDKESKLEGAVNSLADILQQYRYNADNTIWKGSKLTVATGIKGNAESNIVFYRKEINSVFDRQKVFHSYQDADKVKKDLDYSFKYYQLSVYLFTYASFVEIILGGNYSAAFLNSVSDKIRDYAYQYWEDYDECHELLTDYMKGSIEAEALNNLGNVAGKLASKVPVKGVLKDAGRKMKRIGSAHGKKAMQDFNNDRVNGIQVFLKNIDMLNDLGNHPVQMLFDSENIYYLCD